MLEKITNENKVEMVLRDLAEAEIAHGVDGDTGCGVPLRIRVCVDTDALFRLHGVEKVAEAAADIEYARIGRYELLEVIGYEYVPDSADARELRWIPALAIDKFEF